MAHFPSVIFFILCTLLSASAWPIQDEIFSNHMMLDFDWPIPKQYVKYLPHAKSCHHYYQMQSDDSAQLLNCPEGQIFDYVTLQCVKGSKLQCWSYMLSKKDGEKKAKTHFKCPFAWGRYPDVEDCTKFYHCFDNEPKHKKCPRYERFDKIEKKCVSEKVAVCADDEDVVDKKYKCPYTWGSFVYPKDCSKYYKCLNRKASLETCKRDHLFDAKEKKCFPSHKVDCGSRKNPYEKTTTTASKTSTAQPTTRSISTGTSEGSKSSSIPSEHSTPIVTSGTTKNDDYSSSEPESVSTEESKSSSSPPGEHSTPVVTSGTTKNDDYSSSESEGVSTATSEGSKSSPSYENSTPGTTNNTPESISISTSEGSSVPPIGHSTPVVTSGTTENDYDSSSAGTTKDITNESTASEITSTNELGSEASTDFSTTLGTSKEDKEVEISSTVIVTDQEETTTTQSDATPSQEITTAETFSTTAKVFQCPKAKGRFPYKSSCSIYYYCKNSEWKLMKCPKGTLFDVKLHRCNNASEVDCEDRYKSTSMPPSFTTLRESSDQTSQEFTSSSPTETSAKPDECLPHDHTCIIDSDGQILRCPDPTGLFVHPTDSKRFLQCDNNQIYVQTCPAELVFNPVLKRCDWP